MRITSAPAPAVAGEAVLPKWWATVDRAAVCLVISLFAVGILLCFAASVPLAVRHNLHEFHYVFRQFVFGGLALVLMLSVSTLSVETARRIGCILFAGAFAATLLLPILGASYGTGATRWFSLGFVSVQPSEFLKPGLIVLSSWLMAASISDEGLPGLTASLLITAVVVGLLAMQPDFGQAALVIFSWMAIYFAAGAGIAPLVVVFAIAASFGVAAYYNSDHFASRIDEFLTRFLSTDTDARSQVDYAIKAIQEGRLFGVGIGEGSVKWYLPDGHTDFIIAVAAEEFGLVMVAVIMALFVALCVRSLMRLTRISDPFARIAGTGLVASIGMQAFINIAVAVRLVPPKGLTLPLISYGGSSMLATGLLLGILLALTKTPVETSHSAKKRNLMVIKID